MWWSSFPLFVVGMLVRLGVGADGATAAADMYLPTTCQGLGYVLTGARGCLGGLVLIAAAQTGAGPLRLDSTVLAWWLVPGGVDPQHGAGLAHPA